MTTHSAFWSALGVAFLVVTMVCAPARDAEPTVCLELERSPAVKSDNAPLERNILLFRAADLGCARFARTLLDAGAAVEARDRFGAMPLAHAARAGHLDLVRLLLAHGAPIDARDLAGSTALYAAAENDRLAVMRELLEKGADASPQGRDGVRPVAAAD